MKTTVRPEIEMIMDKARRSLASARHSLAGGFLEDAASSAYYAAFHGITALLVMRDVQVSRHGQALGEFNRLFVHDGVFPPDTYRKVKKLFDDRQSADYDYTFSLDEEEAGQDIEAAESFLDEVEKHLSNVPDATAS